MNAADVVECRIKLILGLIWTIILRWQIQKISYQEGSPGGGKFKDCLYHGSLRKSIF